jgi:hypothetical protein
LEEQVGVDEQGVEFERQGLFPDWTELGWKSRILPEADPFYVFDNLDATNTGVVTKKDLQDFLLSISNSPLEVLLSQDALHYSAFSSQLNKQYIKYWRAFLNSNPKLKAFCALKNLKSNKFVDSVVTVSEDEAAFAFLQLLQYTHTIANGKGVLPFAALWSEKIQCKGEKIAILISGI